MNHSKFDVKLSIFMSQVAKGGHNTDSKVAIFVKTVGNLNSEQQEELKKIGVNRVNGRETIFTARLSAAAIEEISAKEYVHSLSLSQNLRPV